MESQYLGISGNFELFVFFKTEEETDFAMQMLQYWQARARLHEIPQPLYKRVKDIAILPQDDRADFFKMVERYYAEGEETVNFAYLRLLYGSDFEAKRVHDQIIYISGTLIPHLSLTANPFIRFFKQFRKFVGVLDEYSNQYNINGSLTNDVNQIHLFGVREIERIALDWAAIQQSSSLMLNKVFAFLINRYKRLGELQRKESLFEKVVDIKVLSQDLREDAIKFVKTLETLQIMLHRHPELHAALTQQIRQLPEYIAAPQEKRSELLGRNSAPSLDRGAVFESLKARYPSSEPRVLQKLAKTIVRVRKNTFSQRTRAPEGYVGVVATTELEGHDFVVRVLPGQPPYEELKVRCSRDTRLLYPVGSFFVVWLPIATDGTEQLYTSYNNILHYLDFPPLVVEDKKEEEGEGEVAS